MITYNDTLHIDTPFNELHQRLHVPLSQLGFSLSENQTGSLVYKRGSRLKNFIAMSPGGWQASLRITNSDPDDKFTVKLDYRVNTDGQVVLQKEKAYFEQEFTLIQQVLNNVVPNVNLEQQASAAKKTNYQVMAAIVVISALVMLVFVAGLYAIFSK